MIFVWYIVFIAIAALSVFIIREEAHVGTFFETVFGLETGTFYRPGRPHSLFVMLMKWPMFLAMVGLIVPTPWIQDFIWGFMLGIAYHAYRWMKARADKPDKTKEA